MVQRRRGSTLGAVLTLLALLAVTGASFAAAAAAQEPVEASQLGEMPTEGGVRPGPIGDEPRQFRKRGVMPIAIKIEKAQVDAQVEQQEIVDGVMQNPSGPFIVSWYRETGRLGEEDNIVMAGHLDYWDVGEAVFYNVWKLKEGDEIEVMGEDDVLYRYEVEWLKSYTVADLDAKGVQEIVGNTKTEKLTLITCGGPFDYNAGEYLERIVVRATRVG
jgi:LPXTG-site transpeptidase (sortase) family protein